MSGSIIGALIPVPDHPLVDGVFRATPVVFFALMITLLWRQGIDSLHLASMGLTVLGALVLGLPPALAALIGASISALVYVFITPLSGRAGSVRTEIVIIGLILSAVVMISRVAPMALLGQRQLPRAPAATDRDPAGLRDRRVHDGLGLPGEGETLRSTVSVVAGALVAWLIICIPTGRLLLAMLAGLAVAAGLSLLDRGATLCRE